MRKLPYCTVIAALVCAFALCSVAFADPAAGGSDLSASGSIGLQADGAITVYDEADQTTTEYSNLQDALDVANRDSGSKITVTLPQGSTYVLAAYDAASHGKLRIYSNTTLDLNGSTILRSDGVVNDGVIYNYPIGYGTRGVAHDAIGGYDMSTNITIKNGTIDGGDTTKATTSSDLVRIDHASNVAIANVKFANVYDCHHLEFIGVNGGTVTGCTFQGFRYQIGHEKDTEYGREAIELDGAWYNEKKYGGDGELWAKDTKLDMTSNKNCTISGCTFTDVPSALGSHHWSANPAYKNSNTVVLENNKIMAASKYKYFKTAITAGGIDNLVVRNNVVDGPYVFTVHAYRGNGISILNNEVDNSSNNAIMVNGNAGNVVVDNNVIKGVSGDEGHGVSIADATVTSVSGNAISNVKHNGISVTSGTIGFVKGNKIANPKEHGISIIAGSVASIEGNSITDAAHNGVNVVSGTIGGINGNVVTNAAEHGISIANKSNKSLAINSIKGNEITGALHNAINVTAGEGGVVTDINENVVSKPLAHGISVLNGTVKSIKANNIAGAKKNGVNIASGTVSKVAKNKIKKVKGHGVSVVGGKVKKILDNTITVSGKKGSGICVTAGKVTTVSGNTIKAAKNGISVVGGKVGKKGKKDTGILKNTVKKAKKGHGISVSGKGMVAAIDGNKVVKPAKNGVSINEKAKVYQVNKNKIETRAGYIGIYLGSTAVDKVKVKKNKITVSKKDRAIYKAWDVTTKESGNKVKVKSL